jgi:predicted phosphoribosyltransferase
MRIFKDRAEAGKRLAWELKTLKGRNPLVLGVPPGGVLLGERLAADLDGDLDVALVQRMRSPVEGGLSLGALGEGEEEPVWNRRRQSVKIDGEWLLGELAEQRNNLAERRALYTPGRGPLSVEGRVVIVVDEGIETGATQLAALRALRKQGPGRLIAAAAVGVPEGMQKLEEAADQVLVLQTPEAFGQLAQFFEDFPDLNDAAVVLALRRRDRERGR